MLPSKNQVTICFAHVAYRLRERFLTQATGIESFEVRAAAALEQRIGPLAAREAAALHPVDRCRH